VFGTRSCSGGRTESDGFLEFSPRHESRPSPVQEPDSRPAHILEPTLERFRSGGPNGIRTRVCCPPRAFSIRSAGCTVLTQHLSLRDSNSAGILVPFSCRALLAVA
jgi:hypothetical protein